MQFREIYKLIGGFNIGALRKQDLQRIRDAMPRVFGSYYLATCFGRMDVIVEAEVPSVRVGSNRFCHLQERIVRSNPRRRPTSMSMVFAKPILGTGVDKIDGAIRSYTFVRPRKLLFPNAEVLKFLEERAPQNRLSFELLWNYSAYPLIVALDGSSLADITETIRIFRQSLANLVADTSTFVTLRHTGKELATDTKLKVLPAVTYLKLRAFDAKRWDRKPLCGGSCRLSFASNRKLACSFDSAMWRTGWFDIMLNFKGCSLRELQECLFTLMQVNDRDIVHSSTVLMA
jgi:hypothetical protein